jgi:Uri superfamily endonuclease
MRGSYALLLSLDRRRVVDVGALGPVDLEEGTYVYCGSALGGLEQRLGRHFRREKKARWHIDHLLAAGSAFGAFVFEEADAECQAAEFMTARGRPVPGFGCSDCSCPSHLFRVPEDTLFEVLEGLRFLNGGND